MTSKDTMTGHKVYKCTTCLEIEVYYEYWLSYIVIQVTVRVGSNTNTVINGGCDGLINYWNINR